MQMRGFGTFTVRRRNARMGRNPRSGEVVPVDEKTAPFFKAGKELRFRLNRDGMKRRTSSVGTAAPPLSREDQNPATPSKSARALLLHHW